MPLTKKEKEARCWSWVSLVIGLLIIGGSASSGAWPVIIVQGVSVAASLIHLFGSDEARWLASTLMLIAAAFELFTGIVMLALGIVLVLNPGFLAGWSVLFGIWLLVLCVPVLSVAAIDLFTASRVRASAYEQPIKMEVPPLFLDS